jgi:16S rRNA (guanine1207-N2)-methyltransferase
MHDARFACTFGEFELARRPVVADLKAWDGADEYLLELAAERTPTSALIVNDQFGALTCALHAHHPVSWGDSFTAHQATRENFASNKLPEPFVALPSTTTPESAFDLVLWRVPKSQTLFEQQIARIRPALRGNTVVLAGGMDKHLLPNTKELLTRLGEVTTLPGRRKSHVFSVKLDISASVLPEPKSRSLVFSEYGLTLNGDAAVFARDKIDIGARFFIEQFTKLPVAQRIADLGCGNGVLGLALARQRPDAEIHCFDESYQAVATARANWLSNIGNVDQSRFHLDDGLGNYAGPPFDLILCNPPFHQQHVIGDHIARQLFAQSRQHLRKGGELWIVGNRHLDYHKPLQRIFGNCRQIAANPKFVVLAARA